MSGGLEPTRVVADRLEIDESGLSTPGADVASWARGGPPEVGRSGTGHHADDHGANRGSGDSGEAAVPHLPASSASQATLDLIDGALSDWGDDIGRDAMRWCPPETITLAPSPSEANYFRAEMLLGGCDCRTCEDHHSAASPLMAAARQGGVLSYDPGEGYATVEANTTYVMTIEMGFAQAGWIADHGTLVDLTPYLARPRWSVVEEIFAGAFVETARMKARRRRLRAMRTAYRARRR